MAKNKKIRTKIMLIFAAIVSAFSIDSFENIG